MYTFINLISPEKEEEFVYLLIDVVLLTKARQICYTHSPSQTPLQEPGRHFECSLPASESFYVSIVIMVHLLLHRLLPLHIDETSFQRL